MKRKRTGLFDIHWTNPENGQRLGRATRRELADAYRLWAIHADVRLICSVCGRSTDGARSASCDCSGRPDRLLVESQ